MELPRDNHELQQFHPPGHMELRNMHPDRPLQWHDYADAWLGSGSLGRYLDYGCGPGHFVRRVASRCAEAWGCDLNREILPADAERQHFVGVKNGELLPFPDAHFDTISILEVIEHVTDERAVLRELARILKPGGRLLLTTPHKGALTWMDPGNLKVLLPRLHRFTHKTLLSNRAYYEERFGEGRRIRQGMYADFSADHKPWHRHYRYEQIRVLADPTLQTVAWAAYYPGMRLCWCSQIASRILTHDGNSKVPWPFSSWSYIASRMETQTGDQLVVLFRKS